jgi:hypothetical protein
MPGITSGSMITATTGFWPRIRYLVKALAPKIPRIVATTDVTEPTLRLFIKAACIGSLESMLSYQAVVKPLSGKAT